MRGDVGYARFRLKVRAFLRAHESHITLLYEPPFTNFAPQGPDALFTSAQVDELFGVLDHVRATARVA